MIKEAFGIGETINIAQDAAKKELGEKATWDEDVLSYIAVPQLAEPFFEKRKEQEENRAVYTIEEMEE